MNTALRLRVAAIVALTALAAPAQEVTPTRYPFLWRVEARSGQDLARPGWLYGTMHAGDRRLVALPQVVDDARRAADAVYLELDLKDPARTRQAMAAAMLLPEGQTLRDRLPADLLARLERFVEKHGGTMREIERMHVWAATLTMQLLDREKAGFTHSLDGLLYREAREAGKEVGGLETEREQIEAFTAGAEKDHVAALRGALDLAEEYDSRGVVPMVDLLDVYLRGDERGLLDKLDEGMRWDPVTAARLQEPVLGRRNERLADRIVAALRERPEKGFFFAVGASHLVGEGGIVARLRAKGYRVTRLQPPPPLLDQVRALEARVLQLRDLVRKQARTNAQFEARMRKLEFQIRVLERRLK